MKLTPASLLFMIFLVIHLELIQAAASTPLSRRNVMDSDENETVPLTLLRSQPPTKQLITENPDSELSTLDIWWNISDHNSKQMRRLGSRSDRQRENKSSGKKSTDTSKKSLDILSKETGRQISNGLLDIRPRSASSTKSHTEARKTRLNSRRRSQSKSRRHHSSNGLEGVNEEADDKVKQESNAKLDYEIFFENSIMSMSMHVTEVSVVVRSLINVRVFASI